MVSVRHPERAGLHLRIVLRGGGVLGPGRAEILEGIARHGSIAAAGRDMGMSYRRAWTLVADIARCFGASVVTTAPGGPRGGGAKLTPLGMQVVALYREVEAKASAAAVVEIAALEQIAAEHRQDKPHCK